MNETMWNPDEKREGLDGRLAERIASLPRELEPARDLWPGIAARLDVQPSAIAAGQSGVSHLRSRSFRSHFVRQALAALLSAAVGAAITFVALGGARQAVPGEAPPQAESQQGAQATLAAYAAAPEPGDYRLVEADYLRAKEALWVSVYSRRDQFSAATLEAVEKNFSIIEGAIFDLRQALAQDPGNLRLEQELYRNHRRGLDLLRRLADST